MKQTGLFKGLGKVYGYKKLTEKQRQELQNKRLLALVKFAKEKSPYYVKLYTGIGEKFYLRDLPTVNKTEMMEHFDEWLTDRNVHLKEIYEFTKDLDNIGRKYKDKYLVFTTSGSTGNPSVVLYDKTALNIMTSVGILRAYARKEDMKAFIKRGKKNGGCLCHRRFLSQQQHCSQYSHENAMEKERNDGYKYS